jgi:hypothetical protein
LPADNVVLIHSQAVVINGTAAQALDLEPATQVDRQCRPIVLHDCQLEAAQPMPTTVIGSGVQQRFSDASALIHSSHPHRDVAGSPGLVHLALQPRQREFSVNLGGCVWRTSWISPGRRRGAMTAS